MSKLKEIRMKSNLSQAELADISGVNIRMISYYEQGVKDINKAQGITLWKIANALNCKIEDLMEDSKSWEGQLPTT